MARRGFLRTLRWVAAALGALVIVLAALVIGLQTGTGRDWLAQAISRVASKPGERAVLVSGIGGSVPFDFTIDELTIADREGPWLRIRGIAADAKAGELARGRIAFVSVTAETVDLARLPHDTDDPDDEPFVPPRAWREVSAEDLRIDALRLGRRLIEPGVREATAHARRVAEDEGAGAADGLEDVEWSVPIAVRASGAYRLHERTGDLRLDAEAESAAGLIPSAIDAAAGALALRADLEGYWLRPRGDVVLRAQRPAAYGVTSSRLEAAARGEPTAAGRDDEAAYDWTLNAVLLSPRVSDVFDPALGPELSLGVRGRVDPRARRIELAEVRLEGAALSGASAGATVDLEAREVVVPELRVVTSDLGALAGAADDVLAGGAAAVSVRGRADLEERSAALTLAGEGEGVRFADEGLERFVGSEPSLAATFEAQLADAGIGAVRVSDLRLEAAQASMSASASVEGRGGEREVAGELELQVADLEGLSATAGAKLEGQLELRASARGPLDALALEVHARPTDVRIAGAPKFGGTVTLAAADVAGEPTGRLEASISSRFGPVEAVTDFALVPDETLALTGARVAAEGAKLTGALTVGLAAETVDGEITGEFSDLRALSPFAGGRLYGEGTLRVALRGDRGQSADVAARVTGFTYAGAATVKAEAVKLDAALRELRARPSGDVRLRGKDVAAADVTLASLDVDANGEGGAWNVQAGAEGRYLEPFRIRAAATVSGTDGGVAARVGTLTGELAGRRLSSNRDIAIATTGDGFTVEHVDLSLGEARIRGQWRTMREEVAGDLAVADLPLSLLRLYEPAAALEGALDASVTASGAPDSIELAFTADAARVEVGAARGGGMPPVDLHAEGRWGSRGLEADASITGGEATAFALHVEAPREGGSLSVEVGGEANVAILNGLGVLGEDRVGGTLRTRLVVSGTPAAPRVLGELVVEDGRYDNAASGAVLRDVDAFVRGEGTRLRVERLTATDGENGTVAGTGVVDLSTGIANAVYDVSARLRSAQVARLDELSAEASGEVRVVGRGASPMVSGTIEAERAELRVPEQLPPDVVVFENVVEKNVGAARDDRFVAPEPPETLPVGLDVDIDMPGRIFVRGSELDTEWKGDLHVGGTSRQPVLEGRLRLVRGSFRILNVRLEAVKGTILFDGGEEIDPLIEIVGETEKNDVVARVTVSGRALAPTIEIGSEPPLPQDEVLARLLFGKTPAELSAVESLQLASAVARLARGGGGNGGITDPLGWLRATLDVDTLDVTSAPGDENGSVLSIGKYVTEDVFVSLNQGLADNTSSASVEVELTDNLTLESEVGRDAEGSLGLNWKWDY